MPDGKFDFTKRLKHPRWRSILVQGTIDHIVCIALTKTSTKAYIEHFQESPLDHDGATSVIAAGSRYYIILPMEEILHQLATTGNYETLKRMGS